MAESRSTESERSVLFYRPQLRVPQEIMLSAADLACLAARRVLVVILGHLTLSYWVQSHRFRKHALFHGTYIIIMKGLMKITNNLSHRLNLKNAAFWDVAPCEYCKTDVSEELVAFIFRIEKCMLATESCSIQPHLQYISSRTLLFLAFRMPGGRQSPETR
jgi:hypothetical protein